MTNTVRALRREQWTVLELADQGKVWTIPDRRGVHWRADRDRFPFVTSTVEALLRRRLVRPGLPDENGRILAEVTDTGRARLAANKAQRAADKAKTAASRAEQ